MVEGWAVGDCQPPSIGPALVSSGVSVCALSFTCGVKLLVLSLVCVFVAFERLIRICLFDIESVCHDNWVRCSSLDDQSRIQVVKHGSSSKDWQHVPLTYRQWTKDNTGPLDWLAHYQAESSSVRSPVRMESIHRTCVCVYMTNQNEQDVLLLWKCFIKWFYVGFELHYLLPTIIQELQR